MDRHLHRPRYPNLAIREVGDVNMSNQQLIVLCTVICLVGFRQVVFALGIILTPFALGLKPILSSPSGGDDSKERRLSSIGDYRGSLGTDASLMTGAFYYPS